MNPPKHDNSSAVYLAAEIREIEQLAAALPGWPQLMEKAGLAAAEIAREKLLTAGKTRALVLAGPGNNGGDAFVVARHLHGWWYKVTLVFTGERKNLSDDAKQALNAWLAASGEVLSEIPENETWDVVIDGLFGIGLDHGDGRNLAARYLDLVEAVNGMNLPVLSLDIPSGLGSDTGTVHGAAIRAAITVTFISLKAGLLTGHGPEYCGEIFVRDLGLDVSSLKEPSSWMMNQAYVQQLLPPPRPSNSHKGMFGSIGIIGGSAGMVGAVLLAGISALKLGAGRVYLGLIAGNALGVDPAQPELMLRPPHDLFKLDNLNCMVVGPGLGREPDASFWLSCALESDLPLVLDADALNIIATDSRIAGLLKARKARKASSILTPHPAEAARLLNTDISAIQNDRMTAVANLATRFNCCAVLKGAGSICAEPGGKRYINATGNPGLSSAGTGDVLSGIAGAFLAQGLSPENSLLLSVYLHGAAADALQKQHGGPMGMIASEIPNAARTLVNQWIYDGGVLP
ncbi:bifunctional ADP-dependent NAD(P)H-hydrate dehydratase/NAD(P)H-hydrate epimerase [Nitrosospira briensis]|uniref:bifunctional ADP-dependent NAD(P)H-hydrate dehydratase/NAD(P)H-hydrate epimerase n=1 Tax=Nitrosospira briensis TaxID=35799 RepID=UPI00046ADC89|nr:bifunctional ADP-dependent NAD(P)H-hydrate dehydratase/NAD(P)H-hydrate epimerase [Nitrosospira briensis]